MHKALAVIIAISSFLSVSPALAAAPATPAASACPSAAATPAPTTATGMTDEKAKALLAAQPSGRDYLLLSGSGIWLSRGSISRLRGYNVGLISQVTPGPRENGADDQFLDFVPVRAVAEALGYDVIWDQKLRQVTLISRAINLAYAKVIFFHMMEPFGFVQGQRTPFTVPNIGVQPFIEGNRAMIPLSFVLNHLWWDHGQVSLRQQGPGYVLLELSTLG